MSFTVELIGHAGTGKSRLAALLVSELSTTHIQCSRSPQVRTSQSWLSSRREDLNNVFGHPRRAAHLLALLARHSSLSRSQLSLLSSSQARLSQHRTLESSGCVAILDEGPWHGLWSFMMDLPAEAQHDLGTIFSLTRTPDLVVSIRVSISRVLRQLKLKPNPHRLLKNRNPENQLMQLDRLLVAMETHLKTRTTVVSLHISDDTSVDDHVELVKNLILAQI